MVGKKRCRLHGGKSTGAPTGSKNGNYNKGRYTKNNVARRQAINTSVAAFRITVSQYMRGGHGPNDKMIVPQEQYEALTAIDRMPKKN